MPPKIPDSLQIALLVSAVAALAGATGLSLRRLWEKGKGARMVARACLVWAIAAAIAAVAWHSARDGRWVPLEDNFAALTTLGILLAGFVLYMERRPIPGLDLFVLPVAALMLISAVIFGVSKPDVYRVSRTWFWVHTISSFCGAAAFAVAAAVGTMYLVVSARLRRKTAPPGDNLGNLERLERITQVAGTLGFALLTLGIITGIVRAVHDPATLLGPHWLTSPKVVLAMCVWAIYAVALHSPITPSVRGRKAAVLSIVGFALMFGVIVVVQFMPGGS